MIMSLGGVVRVASCSLEFAGTRGRYCCVQLSSGERGASQREGWGKAWASNWFKGSNWSCVDTDGWGEHCRGARLDNEMHLFSLLFSSALPLFLTAHNFLSLSLFLTLTPSPPRSLTRSHSLQMKPGSSLVVLEKTLFRHIDFPVKTDGVLTEQASR